MTKPRLDRRGKVILSLAAAAAVLVNAGAAWAYWMVNGEGTGVAVAGTAVELTLTGKSDDSKPLYPGGTTTCARCTSWETCGRSSWGLSCLPAPVS